MDRIGSRNGINHLKLSGNTTSYIFAELQIGDWDMSLTTGVAVAHGLSSTEWKTVKNISVIIRDDLDTARYYLGDGDGTPIIAFDSTDIYLVRQTSGSFDSTGFDSTSYNRGWITFMYQPDNYL